MQQRRRQQTENDWGFFGDVAKIALGVFIGSMAAIFAYEGVLAWRAEQAARQLAQELKAMNDQQRQAQQQMLQQQKEEQRRQIRQELEKDWQRQQVELAAKRKEAAWQSYYKPSPICRLDNVRADCANEHMRARRAFEAEYRD